MKKIININLSGRVIPIEDAAYESLKRYIESLRRYFANEEGRDEIINDIESRVAELMNDKVKKGATAVTEADMEEIISSMGRVEDFEKAEAAENMATPGAQGTTGSYAAGGEYTQTNSARRFKGRLYRDRADKILGGVCSGIANYMNVDPAIVRLLFAIITFGGFGAGIFLYILLWIFLPVKDLEGYEGKRLFRNPEDRIIGGVAGGIAAYFNKETWIIRTIFAAPLILNILLSIMNGIFGSVHGPDFPDLFIGSFTGTFVVAYIILWIVLPEARSPFEKMEMRGEKVDVNRIRQNVQEGMGEFKNRAQDWGAEVKATAQNFGERASQFANTRGRTFATEVGQAARPVASGCGHVIGVLFKSFFLFVAGAIAFALFVIVIVFTVGGVARPFNDFLLNGFWQNASLWGTMIFFLAVPLIAIITWIVRRMMKVRSQNRSLGWVFGGLWTMGWISLIIFIASMTKDWRYGSVIEQGVTTTSMPMNKMVVRIDEPRIRYSGTFGWINDDGDDGGWDITEDSLRLSDIKIRVAKSEDSLYHVTLWKESRGRNRVEASQRAEKIRFTATTMDSALVLASGFAVSKNEKYRGQKVITEVQVPVGKMIRFDETVTKLDFNNVRIAQKRNWRNNDWEIDWHDDNFYNWEPGIDYVMTAEGELVDPLKKATTTNTGEYEYRRDSTTRDTISEDRKIQDEIEIQQRKIEEERRKLDELQRRERENISKINISTTRATVLAQIKSPIFSMLII